MLFGHLLKRLDGRITLLSGCEKGRLLVGMGVARHALDFDASPVHEIFADTPLETCYLPRALGRHDRLVSCFAGGSPRPELRFAMMCGAKNAAFLPVRPPGGASGHLVEIWSDMLGLPACGSLNSDPWAVPEAWRVKGQSVLRELGIEPGCIYAVLHPGAGSPRKCFSLREYLDVAGRISVEQVLFVIGPVELDLWSPGDIDALGERFPLLPEPTLEVLAGILSSASVFVGNDSGPSHLAAALGCPTLALFGPTSPEAFRPLGPMVRIIHEERIENISAQRVLEAVGDLRG